MEAENDHLRVRAVWIFNKTGESPVCSGCARTIVLSSTIQGEPLHRWVELPVFCVWCDLEQERRRWAGYESPQLEHGWLYSGIHIQTLANV